MTLAKGPAMDTSLRFVGAGIMVGTAAGAALGTVESLIVASPAMANPGCKQDGGFPYFAGYLTQTQTLQGAQSSIAEYEPLLCTGGIDGSRSFSGAWVGIVNTNVTSIAQIGYAKYAQWSTTSVYYFWECNDCATNEVDNFATLSNPSNHSLDAYTVYNSSGTDLFIKNGNGIANDKPNFAANQAEFLGEIHDAYTQMPGDTNHQVIFSGPQKLVNGTWYAENPQYMLTPTDEKNQAPYGTQGNLGGNDEWWIWDTRCSNEGQCS
jgi:hypothetical protein